MPRSDDPAPLRIGALTCTPANGHVNGVWAPLLNPVDGRPRRAALRFTHVWDPDREQAERFGAQYGVEVVDGYADMLGRVDGVILGNQDEVGAFKHLLRPYLEAGTPAFANRPFAASMADARQIVDLAARHGAPLMTGSSFEHVKEVEVVRQQLRTAGPVRGYLVDNGAAEYAWHGIHGLLFAYACVGGGVRRVAHLRPDRDDPNGVGVVVLEHEAREGGRPFYGCVQPTGSQAWIKVYTDGGGVEQRLWPEGSAWDRDTFLWLPLLLRLQAMIQDRTMPESYDCILEKTQIFLAGFRSGLECGGAPVALSEVGDWTSPELAPSRLRDVAFA
jgi:hypothetical protein